MDDDRLDTGKLWSQNAVSSAVRLSKAQQDFGLMFFGFAAGGVVFAQWSFVKFHALGYYASVV